jgi:hypothetical protein
MVNFNWDSPDPRKIMEYVRTRGVQGKKSIEILSKGLHFVDVFNTDMGFQLLCDLVMMHSQLLEKICSLEATDNDKIEYKICEELIFRWSRKIKAWEDEIKKVMTKTG